MRDDTQHLQSVLNEPNLNTDNNLRDYPRLRHLHLEYHHCSKRVRCIAYVSASYGQGVLALRGGAQVLLQFNYYSRHSQYRRSWD